MHGEVKKRGGNGTEGAYVHVALSVVVEAEQHQALPSAFAGAPETPQSALPHSSDFPKFSEDFLRTLITTPPCVELVTELFFRIISYFVGVELGELSARRCKRENPVPSSRSRADNMWYDIQHSLFACRR